MFVERTLGAKAKRGEAERGEDAQPEETFLLGCMTGQCVCECLCGARGNGPDAAEEFLPSVKTHLLALVCFVIRLVDHFRVQNERV